MKLYLQNNRKELFIKTALWNSILSIFKKEKGLDISEYLISVKIKDNRITLKTNKPIINSEIFLFDKEIKEDFYKKLKNIWIKEGSFSIKYI